LIQLLGDIGIVDAVFECEIELVFGNRAFLLFLFGFKKAAFWLYFFVVDAPSERIDRHEPHYLKDLLVSSGVGIYAVGYKE
jgi:hypothetical protein